MQRFSIPSWLGQHDISWEPGKPGFEEQVARIRKGLEQFQVDDPEVSIVIPAYNEEKNLLGTLSSFSVMKTKYRVELIVINNNSTDATQKILDACGVKNYFEERQGISFTRQTGFEKAKGTFYLSADADSIYPKAWIDSYVDVLKNKEYSCAYGRYSFIPSAGSSRFALALHEIVAESYFLFRRKRGKDYLNVMGFNFAFRYEDGKKVGGFNVNRQRWQDGWMAMQLSILGKIALVTGTGARVWTSDRRLLADGSLSQAFKNRIQNNFTRVMKLVFQKHVAEVEAGSPVSSGDGSGEHQKK